MKHIWALEVLAIQFKFSVISVILKHTRDPQPQETENCKIKLQNLSLSEAEFTIVVFIHYKLLIAVTILNL